MKRILFFVLFLGLGVNLLFAKGEAEIKFDKLTHDFGTFSEEKGIVTCEFKFKNIGDAPLVINQAIATCGCTVPEYTQEPIMPGKSGFIKVTYNGKGRYPGHFKKAINIRTNAKTKAVRLYIEGNMTAAKAPTQKE